MIVDGALHIRIKPIDPQQRYIQITRSHGTRILTDPCHSARCTVPNEPARRKKSIIHQEFSTQRNTKMLQKWKICPIKKQEKYQHQCAP